MFCKEIHQAINTEFERNHMEEEVEEVLLEFAEAFADKGIMEKEMDLTKSYGRTDIQVLGICTKEDDQVEVFIKRLRIGNKEFEIEDYVL